MLLVGERFLKLPDPFWQKNWNCHLLKKWWSIWIPIWIPIRIVTFLETEIWIIQFSTKLFILLIIFLIIMQLQKDLKVINIYPLSIIK